MQRMNANRAATLIAGILAGILLLPFDAWAGAPCVLTCPLDITTSTDPNQCGAVVNFPPPTTSGSCATITCVPASGSTYAVGETEVTCTAPDFGECAFTITVVDTEPPIITCPPGQRRQGAGPVFYPAPGLSDNCAAQTNCTPPTGSVFEVGNSTVTCFANDTAGNEASCAFPVLVSAAAGAPAMSATLLAVLVAVLAAAGAWATRRGTRRAGE